jgi:uncharacterized protein with FMN-binding domain
MKDKSIIRTIPALIVTAAAAIPAGSALAATAHATSQTFKGPMEDMRWGPVQAVITVKNKKITKVSVNVSPETSRSQFIDQQAVPLLKSETLQAQSATIDEVSGATDTSDAFTQSLQSAIKKAKQHKALK